MSKLLAQAADFGGGFQPPTEAFSTGSDTAAGAAQNMENLVSNLIGLLTVVGGLLFVVYFFLGAFNWISAGGDNSKAQKARDQMTLGVIGLIVIVAAYGLIGIVGKVVGLDLLRPGQMILQKLDPTKL